MSYQQSDIQLHERSLTHNVAWNFCTSCAYPICCSNYNATECPLQATKTVITQLFSYQPYIKISVHISPWLNLRLLAMFKL